MTQVDRYDQWLERLEDRAFTASSAAKTTINRFAGKRLFLAQDYEAEKKLNLWAQRINNNNPIKMSWKWLKTDEFKAEAAKLPK